MRFRVFVVLAAAWALVSCQKGAPASNLPEWAIGPFVRPAEVCDTSAGNGQLDARPVILPDAGPVFDCPMLGMPVKWAEGATFNPAATLCDGRIAVLFRSEDDLNQGIGTRTSRLGLAWSDDGFSMQIEPAPVLFPSEDSQKEYEWPGGCEDPRIAMTADGLYVCLYTQWNRVCPRLAVATSRDLRTWVKHGPAFAQAWEGRFRDIPTKSASIVTELCDGALVIHRFEGDGPFAGKYVMYWGEAFVNVAVSDNLTDWTPLLAEDGSLLRVLEPRDGYFDSLLTECGPPAVLSPVGIVLIYNGKNARDEGRRDPLVGAEAYCPGEALFDASDPVRFLDRLDAPVLQPEAEFERTGQYAAGTIFSEGLVYRDGRWYLYYGCADSRVGVAVCDRGL